MILGLVIIVSKAEKEPTLESSYGTKAPIVRDQRIFTFNFADVRRMIHKKVHS